MNTKFYKYCVVPMCDSTSIRTPKKLFIHVPKDNKIRRKWFTLARRDPASFAVISSIYFCEDHFDLANDMENYLEYTIMGVVSQIKMKDGCLPTKFACQPDRATYRTDLCRPVAEKRRRLAIIKEYEEELNESSTTSTAFQSTIGLPGASSDPIPSPEQQESTKIDKASQTTYVKIISSKYRSEAIQIKINTKQKQTSPIKPSVKSIPTSPFKASELPREVIEIPVPMHLSTGSDEKSDSDVSLYTPSAAPSVVSKASSDISGDPEIIKEENMKWILKATVDKIKKKPQFYIGVPKNHYDLINIIHEQTSIPLHQILLCLKKIRLDSKFSELADDFAISRSYACKIFNDNILKIAKVMRPFIVNLDKAAIKRRLPMAFRKNYYNVTCIIDCLEIECQKPQNALHQALTWSDYKKANTIKYLISSTPNGLVNYISRGYSGRITDVCLVENCDFLNRLPDRSCVMADRGFKHIEPLLLGVGCQLVRPPSVDKGQKLSKEKVKETKKIASFRIHIERLIRRLREFSMLKPHACINNYLLGKLDHIIVIACGLVNLQNPLINK